ncbi:28S ribosomal protein S5, mitochondrial [Varanus komodoensis]|nr:28S ribosomal protein S5, mitochondrial [Varanus komodoensis]
MQETSKGKGNGDLATIPESHHKELLRGHNENTCLRFAWSALGVLTGSPHSGGAGKGLSFALPVSLTDLRGASIFFPAPFITVRSSEKTELGTGAPSVSIQVLGEVAAAAADAWSTVAAQDRSENGGGYGGGRLSGGGPKSLPCRSPPRRMESTFCPGYTLNPGYGVSCQYATLAHTLEKHCYISARRDVMVQQCRQSSFFNKLTADELWKGYLAEASTGKRKGRGKRSKKRFRKNLNKGQIIGEGRSGHIWPGLNAPVMKPGTVGTFTQRSKEEQEKLISERIQQRDEWDKKRKMRVKQRGWTGGRWGGISLGPPDPSPSGETYEDFDSRVIEIYSGTLAHKLNPFHDSGHEPSRISP